MRELLATPSVERVEVEPGLASGSLNAPFHIRQQTTYLT